jgi:hypothetical protein
MFPALARSANSPMLKTSAALANRMTELVLKPKGVRLFCNDGEQRGNNGLARR